MAFRRLLPMSLFLLGLTAATAAADQRVWNLATTGDWETAANWNGGAVPGSADWAEIGEGAGNGGTAVISTAVSDILYLYLGNDTGETGSLEILPGGSLTTTASGHHYVGRQGTGYLTVAGGALMSRQGTCSSVLPIRPDSARSCRRAAPFPLHRIST